MAHEITKEVEQTAQNALAVIDSVPAVIETAEQCKAAADIEVAIRNKIKELDGMRKDMTRPLDDSKKRIMDFFRKPILALEQAKADVNSRITAYTLEEQRKAEAERKRIEAQMKAEAEAEAKRKEAEAMEALESGNAEQAEELIAEAEEVKESVPVVQVQAEKVDGTYLKKSYSFVITDPTIIPRPYLTPDEKKIQKVIDAMKGDVDIPGIKVIENVKAVSRR